MNKQIKAGADIHAGDGGYSEGTQEQYDAFVKVRNKSLAQGRIKELAEQARDYVADAIELGFPQDQIDDIRAEKFAYLIIRECRDIVGKTRDQAIEEEWNVDEAMSTAMFDIEDYFGVK